ncbi:MAG: hypothetical protein HC784_01515 [Hydrococcus sp. CSU_1_8]|nr:hypothetical protein [Hydrococcus sp. CSU_1_8]
MKTKDITLFHLRSNGKVIQIQEIIGGWNVRDISHGREDRIATEINDDRLIKVIDEIS